MRITSAVMVANLILVLGENLAFTLAGLVDDKVLVKLAARERHLLPHIARSKKTSKENLR
jgi:hypothetical protein